jgi:hypothetical protein
VASFVLDQVEAKGVYQIICILRGVGHARVTCTSHVYCKYLLLSLGAIGQATNTTINIKIKIINQSTHFINELPYTNFVTDTCLAKSYKPGNLLSTREISVARQIPLSLFEHSSSQNITCFTRKRVSLRNLKKIIKATIAPTTTDSTNPLLLT